MDHGFGSTNDGDNSASEPASQQCAVCGSVLELWRPRSQKYCSDPCRTSAANAQAHGFEADLWPLERVGAVITRATGMGLSRASVWRLLTGRLGWSRQRPERRAAERDESEIARRVAHEWPRIKNGP